MLQRISLTHRSRVAGAHRRQTSEAICQCWRSNVAYRSPHAAPKTSRSAVRRHPISRALVCAAGARTVSVRALLQSCVSETIQPPPTNEANKKRRNGAVSSSSSLEPFHLHTFASSRPFPPIPLPFPESFQAKKAGFLARDSHPLVPSLRRHRFTRAGKWSGYIDSTCLSSRFWKCDILTSFFSPLPRLLSCRIIVAAKSAYLWTARRCCDRRGEAGSGRLRNIDSAGTAHHSSGFQQLLCHVRLILLDYCLLWPTSHPLPSTAVCSEIILGA